MTATAERPPPRFDWYRVRWWTFVFVANLPVPLLASWGAVLEGGGVGLFGGLAILYLLGATVCALRWPIGRSLVQGGIVVALTQLFPMLQVGCGVLAVFIWDAIIGSSAVDSDLIADNSSCWGLVKGNFKVCVLVFLTAQPLMVLSIVIGAWFRYIRGESPIWFTRRTDPDAEPVEGGSAMVSGPEVEG
jgi:hypothetical protein